VGAGGAARELAPFYALHHGFAKGALFLLVGAMLAAGTSRQRALCLAVAAAVAASVAGLPLTGGALAKAAVKPGLSDAAEVAVSLSSIVTSLVLFWFLRRLWLLPALDTPSMRFRARIFPPVLCGVLAFAGPWFFWTGSTGRDAFYPLAAAPMFGALWPVALALPVVLLLLRQRLPAFPPGDLLLLLPAWHPAQVGLPGKEPRAGVFRFVEILPRVVADADLRLIRWSMSGTLLPIIAVVLLVLLM
jgi:hydrogenase-4 component B